MNNGYELRELLASPQVNGLAGMEKGATGLQAQVFVSDPLLIPTRWIPKTHNYVQNVNKCVLVRYFQLSLDY
jgi:hypothetical protein